KRDGAIRSQWMAVRIGYIMRQSAQRKGIFVQTRGIAQHCRNKIAAAHVVSEIRKKFRTERVIAHVLNNAAAVCVGVRSLQVAIGYPRKALTKQWLDRIIPDGINDGFMTQNRVGMNLGNKTEQAQNAKQKYGSQA